MSDTKKDAAIRLYRAVRKLYKAAVVLDDTGALLSPLIGLGNECATIRDIRRRIEPVIAGLQRLEDRGVVDLDDTMKSILRQKAEGKKRATKGAR